MTLRRSAHEIILLQARLTAAAMKLCAREEEIAGLTRQARAVPGCEIALKAEDGTDRSVQYCSDVILTPDGDSLPWWEARAEDLEGMCEPCLARVQLWAERQSLRAGLGGLKRSLMHAYRAALGLPQPKDQKRVESPKFQALRQERQDHDEAMSEGPF